MVRGTFEKYLIPAALYDLHLFKMLQRTNEMLCCTLSLPPAVPLLNIAADLRVKNE